jgi:hypothetical protein
VEEGYRVVEPEIVGEERPEPPRWRRFLARTAFAACLGLLGLVLALIGLGLTLSIVGAAFGIPLALIGLFLAAAALTLPLTRR